MQRLGTAAVGRLFGPVIVLWFAALAAAGVYNILAQPGILAALIPLHALHFLIDRGPAVLLAVVAIVLALTGAEALLMAQPAAIDNLFYRMFPAELIWPVLALGVLAAVLGFGSSSVLAGACGIAVTRTMMITTVLTFVVVRMGWRLPAPLALGATAFFLVIDALRVAGRAMKFFDGGWFPLAVGALLFGLMHTWQAGRARVLAAIRRDGLDLASFVGSLDASGLQRCRRVAGYPVADPTLVPQALLHKLKHNQVLHATSVVATVQFAETPFVDEAQRVQLEPLGQSFWRARLRLGFMEQPDVPRAMALCRTQGLEVPLFETSWFLSRETLVPADPTRGMLQRWRDRLFGTMSRNAGTAAAYFRLPDNAVVEPGTRVQVQGARRGVAARLGDQALSSRWRKALSASIAARTRAGSSRPEGVTMWMGMASGRQPGSSSTSSPLASASCASMSGSWQMPRPSFTAASRPSVSFTRTWAAGCSVTGSPRWRSCQGRSRPLVGRRNTMAAWADRSSMRRGVPQRAR